jgi:two-component system, NtrC family, response regulator AlgB
LPEGGPVSVARVFAWDYQLVINGFSKSYIGPEHLRGNFLPNPVAEIGLGDPVSIDKLEELHIRRVLARAKSIEDAAHILGMDPATLWRRRKKYGI